MGFDLSGYVLKPPRSAPSNATTTAGADDGVVRNHGDLPGTYVLPGNLVEASADQYRAAVLDNPVTTTQEYLFWAANSSNLAVVEDPTWAINQGTGTIPTGTLTVVDGLGTQTDGTARLMISDDDGRSIAQILSIAVTRGDTKAVVTATVFASVEPDAGIVTLASATLTALGGGASSNRGDAVTAVVYVLAAQRFWWTRNDTYVQRFGWDGVTQRWQRFKGGSPVSVGTVSADGSYTLTPRPTATIGAMLPGDLLTPDSYAMVRVGRRPDANSTPLRVLVVTDDEASNPYSFGPTVDAVVGSTSGVLQFNPTFITAHAGQGTFYSPEAYTPDSKGILRELKGAIDDPPFIAPIPEVAERPFIRLGSRRPMTPIPVLTEADLATLVVAEGEFGWARSTGRLKLSAVDVAKADPGDPGFDLLYLGAVVVYDGVSMTQQSVPTRAPVQLVDSSGTPTVVGTGDLYAPLAGTLPTPGTSGVYLVPDGSGTIPNTSITPSTRPNGSGLVRVVTSPAGGDLILFSRLGALDTAQVVEFESDIPNLAFKIRAGLGMIAEELGTGGSKVALGAKDRRTFAGEPMYLLQAEVQPLVYAAEARVVSRVREPFSTLGTEVLALAVDGTVYLWNAASLGPAGDYTAAQVAASIDATITGTGRALAQNGRVWVEAGNLDTGSVEIGFGSTTSGAFVDRDISGCALLGLLPGWQVANPGSTDNWLSDSGFSLGVARSPRNLDRSQPIADLKARGRFTDVVLSNAVIASPVFSVNNPPLIDVAGYDAGVFFQVVQGPYRKSLAPFLDTLYDFEQSRFLWLNEGHISAAIQAPVEALPLGNAGVVGLTMNPAVAPGYGLYIGLTGGPRTLQTLGTDYLLPDDGGQGIATLVEVVGGAVATGALGSFGLGGTTFTDPDATFLIDGVAPGYRLEIIGGPKAAQGSYIVASVPSETTLDVMPDVPFPVAGSTAEWALYTGFTDAVFDPGLIADVVYEEFDHLPGEPFIVRLLSSVGAVPPDAASQSASRLVAVAADALMKGRDIDIRFGLPNGSPQATISVLGQTKLGTLANSALTVPDVLDPHFTNADFLIRVGASVYTIGTNLVGVVAFTNPLLGDQIEYGLPSTGIAGQLNFGTDTLANLEASTVYYVEKFLDPAVLVAGVVELDASTGDLNFSAPDMTTYAGVTAYFVERMITKRRLDVVISPLQGAVYFNTPLRDRQIVEVDYFQADVTGAKALDADGNPIEIIETLPLFVRQETASVVDSTTFSFNPTGRTVRADIEPQVWVNRRLKNYGNTIDYVFLPDLSEITFLSVVDPSSLVQISYAVLEAFGGERAYTVSTPPAYRPPFLLLAGSSTFALQTNRTSDLVPGRLLRVGPTPFYVKASSYDVGTDTTTVTIFPTPALEAGSRAPGNDVLSLLSSMPVTTLVDGVSTGGSPGFLLTLSALYQPADKGMLALTFQGDVTQFAVAGHLMEVGGEPYLVSGSALSSDGLYTTVNITSPLLRGYDPTVDAVRLSVRPIYPPDARNLLGLSGVVATQPIEVVLFGEVDDNGNQLPGRTLIRGVDYDIVASTGDIRLLAPAQPAFGPGQRLFVTNTRLRTVHPFLASGAIVTPTYGARYSFVTSPSTDNGLLGTTLAATYSFDSPDSFYVRTVPMAAYMGEVASIAINRVASRTPHGGPVVVSAPATSLWTYGTVPLLAGRRELLDQDRAARVFVSVYDEIIRDLEQVQETIEGAVIGDRDGKFRFFVGRGRVYNPPGWEDEITGYLNSRLVWSDVFLAATMSFGVTVLDPIVDPATATQDPTTLVVSGNPMGPWLLDFYIRKQRDMVRNDMDDVILAGKGRSKLVFLFAFKVSGDFRGMWQPSVISRLFPERTLAFTTTYPGIGAGTLPAEPGSYSFLKRVAVDATLAQFTNQTTVLQSTFGMDIASISNPALGQITGLTGDTKVRPRLPRARIWAYSPTGFADIDPASDGLPAVVATPLYLKDFPLDPTTGLPDVTRLTDNGGDLPDLSTGDVELSTPAWYIVDTTNNVLPQVAFGVPMGTNYSVGIPSKTLLSAFGGGIVFTSPIYKGVFIGQVLSGCILTFADEDGNAITDAADIAVIGPDGTTLPFGPSRGDTIYVVSPDAVDASTLSDPPKEKDVAKFFKNQPFLDVGVRERSSTFVDRSLPSWDDPNFGIKEIVRQRTATPLMPIEAEVQFANVSRDPLQFPALTGQTVNDSGDVAIPYLAVTNTELDRLGAVQGAFTAVTELDTPTPSAVYPDEVVGNDGAVYSVFTTPNPPATLITARDMTPVVTAGSYTPHSGVGDVASFDLLLVEVGQAGIAAGATGIISIGAVSSKKAEPPRFVAPSRAGDRFRYLFTNAMVHLTATGLSGMTVTQVGPNTRFDITSVGGLFFNNGAAGTVGGLNDLFSNIAFPFPNDNLITLRLIDQGTGLVVETITIDGAAATGAAGAAVIGATPTANQKHIIVPAVGFVLNLGVQYDFTLSVNSFNGGSVTAGSITGHVDTDRLTFVDTLDLRSIRQRGSVTIGGISVQARLRVARVTASGNDNCTVNGAPEINANQDLTFLDRDGTGVIGTFDPSPGTGLGTTRVMAFEGQGNVPIPTTAPITFSAVPSSSKDATGDILKATAASPDGTCSLRAIVLATGSTAQVVSGDIVEVLRSSIGDAAVKAGTYLVRHAVTVANPVLAIADTHEVDSTAAAGSTSGWAESAFPTVVSTSLVPFKVTVTTIQAVTDSPSGYDFDTTGRLFILPTPSDLTTAFSVAYTAFAFVGSNVEFTLTSGSGLDSAGGVLADATVIAQTLAGYTTSGMVFLPTRQFASTLPANNLVGYNAGITTIGGFTKTTFANPAAAPAVKTWAFGVDLVDSTGGVPGAGQLGVWVSDAPGGTYTSDSTTFLTDAATPVYQHVPMFLDLRGVSEPQWNTIHGTVGLDIDCLVPGDTLATNDNAGNPGFLAQAGVFLEPSFPRSAIDIGGLAPLVVDAGHALTTAQIGMRDAAAFGLGASENVYFEVHRIRRFHTSLDTIGENLAPLRFAYEIRTGTVSSYTASTFTFVATGAGTQLGGFNNVDVNVHAGDDLRVLDGSGNVVDSAEVAAVVNATTLVLRAPGFNVAPPTGGETFQVYLRQAPVPHEQSNAQLLDFITNKVLYQSTANPVTGDGGRVDTLDFLKDGSGVNFTTLGLQAGDIVLVDPAGQLAGPTGPASPVEEGSRSIGDQSVIERGPTPPYIAGGPSQLDDNRGWYRVVSVTTTQVEVSGLTEFSGADDGSSFVEFGAAGQEFAVLPTVHASGLTLGVEGQMGLRPTKPAGTSSVDPDSYKGNFFSIEPFSYRIIRPTGLISTESVDLILLMRERMLSWMEELATAVNTGKQGSYYVFQRDQHIDDLGSTTDPDAGLGVPSNLFVSNLSGLTQYAPFANVSDCLSVLDRRYWCLDLRLDNEFPPYSVVGDPYSSFEEDNSVSGYVIGSGRPVEPDRIDDVLDRTDRLRELRYAWIQFRAEQVDGTLPSIIRFDLELPRRLQEQENLLRLQESFDSTQE